MSNRRYHFRLRSVDGRLDQRHNQGILLNNNSCDVIFNENQIGLRDLLKMHPNNKFYCKVVYFGLYAEKGVRVYTKATTPITKSRAQFKCSGIDIMVDEFRGCYYKSSNEDQHTVLATANADFVQSTDETNRAAGSTDTGPNIEACGFYIGADESPTRIVSITNKGTLSMRIRQSTVNPNVGEGHEHYEKSHLCSFDEDGNIQQFPHYICEFELWPYIEKLDE